MPFAEDVLKFAFQAHNAARSAPEVTSAVLAACDLIYSARLLAVPDLASVAKQIDFHALLSASFFAGTDAPADDRLNVHLTAYALGAINLVRRSQTGFGADIVESRNWRIETLIDPANLLPRWPQRWSYHDWRVSHWIGGAASILKSLWHLMPEQCAQLGMPRVTDVLESSDSLISAEAGSLHAYRSELIHSLFRQAYRIRHDPDAGEVGGIAHLHWVNYAESRLPYKAAPILYDRAWVLMQRAPFMEKVPYCLDFDVVQIVRTAANGAPIPSAVAQRASRYASDIMSFMQTRLDASYALHKLPGALATVHECAQMCGRQDAFGLAPKPVDIIREAFWI